jgi:catechol 2,3-dioxygenase-like lactoylglutathione lyase family enzyme
MTRLHPSAVFCLLLCTTTAEAHGDTRTVSRCGDSAFRPYLLALVVPNVGRTARWYHDTMGFVITRTMDLPQYDSLKVVFLRRGEAEFELIQKATSFSIRRYVPDYDGFNKAPLQGMAKLAFWVDDADSLAHGFREKGVEILAGPYDDPDFGIRSLIIMDCDGNVLQFNEPLRSRR